MIFSSPQYFYLLILLPFFAWYQYRRRRAERMKYPGVTSMRLNGKTWRQRLFSLPTFCFYLALTVFCVALARPQVEVRNKRQAREGIAIEMVIDVSSSMDTTIRYGNKESTRMEVAKKVVEEFIAGNGKDLPGRPDDLIGVITFARYADTICPLTLSHAAVIQMIRSIQINNRPNEDGTAYGDAALLAAAHLKAMEQKDPEHTPVSKIVVLLTDGENNCGRYLPLQAAAMARQWGIRIYTISIQASPQPVKVDVGGETQLLPPACSASDDLLRQMAEMTGGIFRTAYDFDSLQAVYREIDRLEKSRMKAITYTDYKEAFPPFVLAGIVLLFLQQVMNTFIFRVVP